MKLQELNLFAFSQAVEEAFVPVIKLCFDGIEVRSSPRGQLLVWTVLDFGQCRYKFDCQKEFELVDTKNFCHGNGCLFL